MNNRKNRVPLPARMAAGLAICWLPFGFAWATPKAAESADAPVTRSGEAAPPAFARPQALAKPKPGATANKAQSPKNQGSRKRSRRL